MADETRSLSYERTINAPIDAVWRALADAEGLNRWFSVDARVEPGVGGKVWVSWGPGSEGESRIEIWEPNKRLRMVVDGLPVPFAMEYFLEARGGATVLRLVNSGFGAGADWDDQYHATDGGWQYFLFNLQHYLERHAGTPRGLAYERRVLTRPGDEVRRALIAALGLPAGAEPAAGAPIALDLGGERLTGTLVQSSPPEHLCTALPGLNDATLFFELEPGQTKRQLGSYLSTYGLPAARVEALRRQLATFLDTVLVA